MTTTIPAGPAASAALNAYNGGPAGNLNDLIVQGWISEGNSRGTWTLLYSCTFTIGLCVWTAIHPNIRGSKEGRWHAYWRKLIYVGIAILAPEGVLCNALVQLKRALYLKRKLNHGATARSASRTGTTHGDVQPGPLTEDEVSQENAKTLQTEKTAEATKVEQGEWATGTTPTVKHTQDLNARQPSNATQTAEVPKAAPEAIQAAQTTHPPKPAKLEEDTKLAHASESSSSKREYSFVFCYYVIMGGLVVDISNIYAEKAPVALTPLAVLRLQDAGKADVFAVSDEDIKDKSKADLLAKGLAVCQIGWLVVQSIGRARAGLTLTLLEIHTMVHVIGAIIMYACWWSKPKDLKSTTLLDAKRIEPELRAMLQEKPRSWSAEDVLEGDYLIRRAEDSNIFPPELDQWDNVQVIAVAPILSVIYAAVHMTASAQWGARGHYFPTQTEATWWDVACYFIFGAVLLFYALAAVVIGNIIWGLFERGTWQRKMKPFVYAVSLVFWLTLVAKMYVVIESFISLRAVPLAIYAIPSWTQYLPHL